MGEQGLFQEVQIRRPSSSLRRQVLHLAGDAALPGRPQQLGGRSAGGGEDAGPPLILLQMVTGEGDRHRMGLLQQAGEHLYLLGSKVGEAVQPQVPPRCPGAVLQLLRRPGQPVPGVQGHLGSEGIVSPADQGQVPQLLSLRSLRLTARPLQVCRGDPAALQLVYSGDQAAEERGPPR